MNSLLYISSWFFFNVITINSIIPLNNPAHSIASVNLKLNALISKTEQQMQKAHQMLEKAYQDSGCTTINLTSLDEALFESCACQNSIQNENSPAPPPEENQPLLLTQNNLPSWIKIVLLTSPQIRLKEINKKIYAPPTISSNEFTVQITPGWHSLWYTTDSESSTSQLYGFDATYNLVLIKST
ncbi:hypothetical protein JST56_01220 [Candidatus Dependentiae bacterium]|nr:hypothetical protein [Candidatus Dependentiae bacterium]